MTDFVDRLERACSRAEYEFPRLAAPDGTVAVSFTDLRQLLASVGRNPEGQDREAGLGRNDEHAVGATGAETPNPGSTPETGLVEALEWQLIETAPVATSFLAAYFYEDGGEWIYDVAMLHRDHICGVNEGSGPFTHWRSLPEPPSLSNVLPDEVGGQPLEQPPATR